METKTYDGLNIFQEAKQRKADGMGYHARRYKVFGRMVISYGIRWSDKWQLFPIWNMSNNCDNALMFGFWKLYLEFSYTKKFVKLIG